MPTILELQCFHVHVNNFYIKVDSIADGKALKNLLQFLESIEAKESIVRWEDKENLKELELGDI